jgi:hypothetical protein
VRDHRSSVELQENVQGNIIQRKRDARLSAPRLLRKSGGRCARFALSQQHPEELSPDSAIEWMSEGKSRNWQYEKR